MQRATSLDCSASRHCPGGTGSCVQVPAPSQTSAVHGSRSSLHAWPAGVDAPTTQTPSTQDSPLVHALPSSQAPTLGTCIHVPVALQMSSVQSFLSLVQ